MVLLGSSARAVSPRSTLPVLSNVLLETAAEGLRVTATNLDLTITVTVPATVLEEGRTTVPARLLGEFVSSLGDAPCSMELEPTSQVLKLTGGVHRANLHGIDAVEFPPLPARDTDTVIEVDLGDSAERDRADGDGRELRRGIAGADRRAPADRGQRG